MSAKTTEHDGRLVLLSQRGGGERWLLVLVLRPGEPEGPEASETVPGAYLSVAQARELAETVLGWVDGGGGP